MPLVKDCGNVQKAHFNFDKLADSYDLWYSSSVGLIYDQLEKQAVEILLADVPKGGRLLEVGCGTGHWSSYFSSKGFEVTGIDVSAKMIERAVQKHIPNSRFEIADGRDIPFENDSYDAAAAITVLEFAAEPEKIISEMLRCVKSKGYLIIGVLNALNSYNRKKQAGGKSMYSSAHLYSPQQIKKLFSRYGKISIRTTGFVPMDKRLLRLSMMYEHFGQFFCPEKGAFIAARIDL